MIYLSQILGMPVIDLDEHEVGVVEDLGIDTGEVFPRITSLTFRGQSEEPLMISWRKYVKSFDLHQIRLNVSAKDLRFSYLQPEEVLIRRDLLHKKIIDTNGIQVVRVDDLKLSNSGVKQLRLVGAVVSEGGGASSNKLSRAMAGAFGKDSEEHVIAWNYIDLLDRNLDGVELSVNHKTLNELHPADIASIIEQLSPDMRAKVFAQLDNNQAAETIAELDEDEAAEIVDDMDKKAASRMLNEMDPDDAAELVAELDCAKADELLKLMGIKEQQAVRKLLEYREETAGRIMTSEFVGVSIDGKVQDAIDKIRTLDEDFETINYVYLLDDAGRLQGTISIRALIVSPADTKLKDIACMDVIYSAPEEDQEDVALSMSKYNLLAMPIVDESMHMLGIVTADDALDIMEEEHEEDLQIAGASHQMHQDEQQSIVPRVFNQALWSGFWFATIVVLGIIGSIDMVRTGGLSGVDVMLACAFLPFAYSSAESMLGFVTSFYFDTDHDEEEEIDYNSFVKQAVSAGILWAAIIIMVWVVCSLILNGLTPDTSSAHLVIMKEFLNRGLIATAIAIILTWASASFYLNILRKRDEDALETSGVAMKAVVFTEASLLFIVSLLIISSLMGVVV